MKIIDDLISKLTYDSPLRDIRQGPFQTAVLTRNCGLASTPHDPGPHHDKFAVAEAGSLLNKNAKVLASLANSPSLHEAAIGMATINSLIEVNQHNCTEQNASDLLIQKGDGKRVAIIGHFPFIPELRKVVKELWVIEKNPWEGDVNEPEAENLVPQANVVGITGTSFTNHTIEHLLNLCDTKAYIVVLGDTAPLSRVLFDYGINAVSGTKVVDPELALRCVSEGATYLQIKGVRKFNYYKRIGHKLFPSNQLLI